MFSLHSKLVVGWVKFLGIVNEKRTLPCARRRIYLVRLYPFVSIGDYMKRSEMVKKIHERLKEKDHYYEDDASELLGYLQELGMLPPVLNLRHKALIEEYNVDTEWESE